MKTNGSKSEPPEPSFLGSADHHSKDTMYFPISNFSLAPLQDAHSGLFYRRGSGSSMRSTIIGDDGHATCATLVSRLLSTLQGISGNRTRQTSLISSVSSRPYSRHVRSHKCGSRDPTAHSATTGILPHTLLGAIRSNSALMSGVIFDGLPFKVCHASWMDLSMSLWKCRSTQCLNIIDKTRCSTNCHRFLHYPQNGKLFTLGLVGIDKSQPM